MEDRETRNRERGQQKERDCRRSLQRVVSHRVIWFVQASGNELLLNQFFVQALKLRSSTAVHNKTTANPLNGEERAVVAEACLTPRAVAQREHRP